MKFMRAYLNFDGNCAEAMKFYHQVFGGELNVMTGKDGPGDCPTSFGDRVMHSRITKGNDIMLMASDCPPNYGVKVGNNFCLNIECESVAELDKMVATLSEGGNVTMPAGSTFFAQRFCMLTDRFGIGWMLLFHELSVPGANEPAAAGRHA